MTSRTALIAAALAAGLALAGPARAGDGLTLQLKWVPQAQFAGYYIAQARGLYRDQGLDVTIRPGGPGISPVKEVAEGRADVVVDWMADALAEREKGTPLVNIAQIFKYSGLMLVCHASSGIHEPQDLAGKKVGVWFGGNEFPFFNWMRKLGLGTKGGPKGVEVVEQGYDVKAFVDRKVDCASAMTYNEYGQMMDARVPRSDMVLFKYERQGTATLEDGLYVLQDRLKDQHFFDRLARFLAASLNGWRAAASDSGAAVDAVVAGAKGFDVKVPHQMRMLAEVNRLVDARAPDFGRLSEKDYERTVRVLLAGGPRAVISREPEGAWTHAVWDAARRLP